MRGLKPAYFQKFKMTISAGALRPSCRYSLNNFRRKTRVQANQTDDKETKTPKAKAPEVSPEKLRAAVEKLKADGVDEKVARKVPFAQLLVEVSLTTDHVKYTG
jgi:hypothetical protein